MAMTIKVVSKGKLKAKMLEYFREIERTKEELIVLDRNRPVLRIIPITPKKSPKDVFTSFQGKVKYKGDILESTEEEWGDLK
ncbi:MAG: type II toxin-antitoxin system Phd/YefM family antitoxin [Thermodesulfobacteriota bacterium]